MPRTWSRLLRSSGIICPQGKSLSVSGCICRWKEITSAAFSSRQLHWSLLCYWLTDRWCSEQWRTWIHPVTNAKYEVTLHTAKTLSEADFDACFRLIELTSSDDYKSSRDGWKPRSKRKEMRLVDLKYFLVKRDNHVEGFLSFMPTYEDGYPVIYCYEIHLASPLQGWADLVLTGRITCTDSTHRTGLGTVLMQHLQVIGSRIPKTAKTMLTCFVGNQRGVKFYERLGYAKDEYSPPPKILRNRTKIEAEYVILSKAICP